MTTNSNRHGEKAILDQLADLGFSGLEAASYLALLREPAATGYRISRLIGKPVPNTYKALDSLRARGAAVLDESNRGRTYVALPIGEYLSARKRDLDARYLRLEQELQKLNTAVAEGGIYQLNRPEQVYERARSMLKQASGVALLDVFPRPLAVLKPDLVAAARRGVRVLVLAYAPAEAAGCEVLAPEQEAEHLTFWNGDWLNLTVDCREYLYALLRKDGYGVHRAVWCREGYLGLLAYNGMLNEAILNRVFCLMHEDRTRVEIDQEVRRMSKRFLPEAQFYSVAGPWCRERGKQNKRRSASERTSNREE
jgi:sugar-specific transcriptional regulator TrmB